MYIHRYVCVYIYILISYQIFASFICNETRPVRIQAFNSLRRNVARQHGQERPGKTWALATEFWAQDWGFPRHVPGACNVVYYTILCYTILCYTLHSTMLFHIWALYLYLYLYPPGPDSHEVVWRHEWSGPSMFDAERRSIVAYAGESNAQRNIITHGLRKTRSLWPEPSAPIASVRAQVPESLPGGNISA